MYMSCRSVMPLALQLCYLQLYIILRSGQEEIISWKAYFEILQTSLLFIFLVCFRLLLNNFKKVQIKTNLNHMFHKTRLYGTWYCRTERVMTDISLFP